MPTSHEVDLSCQKDELTLTWHVQDDPVTYEVRMKADRADSVLVEARLQNAGKFVIIAAMFIGRVGPLTLLMALTAGGPPPRYRYPSENLVVG